MALARVCATDIVRAGSIRQRQGNMTYNVPKIGVLGKAVRIIQGFKNSTIMELPPTQGDVDPPPPAYEIDEFSIGSDRGQVALRSTNSFEL
jgi:hypothetical protein